MHLFLYYTFIYSNQMYEILTFLGFESDITNKENI